MAYLRLLGHHIDPVHIKPGNISRTASLLYAPPPTDSARAEDQRLPRRQRNRRCGVDRRRQQHPALLDTRSPHACRKEPRRHILEDSDWRDDPGTEIVTSMLEKKSVSLLLAQP